MIENVVWEIDKLSAIKFSYTILLSLGCKKFG